MSWQRFSGNRTGVCADVSVPRSARSNWRFVRLYADGRAMKRQLKVLSASQYDRFACPRRGVLEYVHGFKQPPTDSLLLGSRVHAEAESYLKMGEGKATEHDRTAWDIFAPAIPLIPQPGTCETERAITFETLNSPWRGAIDFLGWDGDYRLIGDFKTTKSIKYRKTEAELKKNVQANLYAYWALNEVPCVVRGHWVYLSTGPVRGAHVTHVDFEQSAVEDFIGRVDERAGLIQGWLAEGTPLSRIDEVETDTTKCFEYGKTCHHRLEGRCIIKAQEAVFTARGENMGESILDRIKRQKAEAAKATSIEEQEAIELVKEVRPGLAKFVDQPIGEPEAGFINPPEGAEKRGDLSNAISEGLTSLAAEDKERASEADERAQLKAECVRLGLCEPNSRLRVDALRKLLLDAKGLSTEGRPMTMREVMEAEEPAVSEPTPSMQREEKRIDVLYIDCLPNHVTTDAHTLVAKLLPDVLSQVGESHVKFVQYGKGTAALAVAVQKRLNETMHGDMFADSRTIDADVLAVLVRNAETVVRGLR